MIKPEKASHPSCYLLDYIEYMGMTQEEFAKRLGITPKQVSLLLSEKANITPDIAYRLARLMGTSVKLWLNLQALYDAYMVSLTYEEKQEQENEVFNLIDKDFFYQVDVLTKDENKEDKMSRIREVIQVSSFNCLETLDIYASYRCQKVKEPTRKNIVCKNVWVSVACNMARQIECPEYNEKKLLSKLDEIKSLSKEDFKDSYNKLFNIFRECGVAFIVLPNLKGANVCGAVKWFGNKKVMLAVSTLGAYLDRFWFSLFHEIKHILQKNRRYTAISEEDAYSDIEIEANQFAEELLLPKKEIDKMNKLAKEGMLSKEIIINLANKLDIHPGIVVLVLQKEKIIKRKEFNELRDKIEYPKEQSNNIDILNL